MEEGRYVLSDALWYADVLHGNKLRELCQIKDVSNFLTEFWTREENTTNYLNISDT